MNHPIKIDITDNVMEEITKRGIQMKSRNYFIVTKILKTIGIIALSGVVITAVAALIFSLKFEFFKEYFEFGRMGLISLISIIPWAGVIIGLIGFVLIYLLLKSITEASKMRYVLVTLLAFLMLLIGFNSGTNASPGSVINKIANGYRLGNEPQRIEGIIQEISNDTIVVESDGKQYRIKLHKTKIQKDQNLQIGDKVLILANKREGTITANIIKILDKYKQNEENSQPRQKEIKESQEPEAKTEEPIIAPTSQVSTSASAPTSGSSGPTSSPPVPVDNITISLGSYIAPKYSIQTSINYSSSNTFKVLSALYPTTPVYPTHYQGSAFNIPPNPNMSGWVENVSGPGAKYNVRVCEYSGGACSKYSNIIVVTFP